MCPDAPNPFDVRLIDRFQHGMPICERPYADMADALGCTEEQLLQALRGLIRDGVVSRVGPVFMHGLAGASTLAAMAVPPDRLDAVADLVTSLPEVNHNYLREHHWNLWFVLTAPDRAHLDAVLLRLRERTGLDVLDLPMQQAYGIDLGFPIGAAIGACT